MRSKWSWASSQTAKTHAAASTISATSTLTA
jgi:hypothetical protein